MRTPLLIIPGTLPPMNVFFNTPGACHIPQASTGLPEERCRPMSREPALEVGGCLLTLSPLPVGGSRTSSDSEFDAADIISEGPTPRQTSTQAEEESTQVTARELAPACAAARGRA